MEILIERATWLLKVRGTVKKLAFTFVVQKFERFIDVEPPQLCHFLVGLKIWFVDKCEVPVFYDLRFALYLVMNVASKTVRLYDAARFFLDFTNRSFFEALAVFQLAFRKTPIAMVVAEDDRKSGLPRFAFPNDPTSSANEAGI